MLTNAYLTGRTAAINPIVLTKILTFCAFVLSGMKEMGLNVSVSSNSARTYYYALYTIICIWYALTVYLIISDYKYQFKVTRLSLEREAWSSNFGPIKSDIVLSTSCHSCNSSSKRAVLPRRNVAEIGLVNSLHALSLFSEYQQNIWFDILQLYCIINLFASLCPWEKHFTLLVSLYAMSLDT